MAKRQIIEIDEKKCNGCGLCVPGCAEGALQIVDGKARLISDLFCDGLGACIGTCPQGAIEVIEREAEDYDEVKVLDERIIPAGENTIRIHLEHLADHGADDYLRTALEHLKKRGIEVDYMKKEKTHHAGCPGKQAMTIERSAKKSADDVTMESKLTNWPVQLDLISPHSPYLKNADIVILADCVAYAYANTHRDFIDGRVVLIGCPKLDDGEAYVEKISSIVKTADPASIKVVRMEVPCCGGMVEIVKQAIIRAGKVIPFEVAVIGINGERK